MVRFARASSYFIPGRLETSRRSFGVFWRIPKSPERLVGVDTHFHAEGEASLRLGRVSQWEGRERKRYLAETMPSRTTEAQMHLSMALKDEGSLFGQRLNRWRLRSLLVG